MMDFGFVRRCRTAGEDVLAEFVMKIQIILDLIPDVRRFLPFVNESWSLAIENAAWVHTGHCYRLLCVEFHKALLVFHTGRCLATKFWSGDKDCPRGFEFSLNFLLYKPFVIHRTFD